MGVIKSNNVPSAQSAAAFNFADIEQQARALVLRAKAQADQILADATRQAAELRANALKGVEAAKAAAIEEGKKLGKEQGIAQALPQAKAQALKDQTATLTNAIAGLANAAAELEAHQQAIESIAKTELLQLSVAIARRVVKVVSDRDLAVLEANVADAVRLVVDKSAVRIAVAPSQLNAIRDLLPQLQLTWPTLKRVDLTEDAAIQPGGCRVFSSAGEVDAQVDRMLDRIVSELNLDERKSEPASETLPAVDDVNE